MNGEVRRDINETPVSPSQNKPADSEAFLSEYQSRARGMDKPDF